MLSDVTHSSQQDAAVVWITRFVSFTPERTWAFIWRGKTVNANTTPMPCLPLVPLGGVSGGNNPHVLDSHGLCLFSILWWIKSHQNSCISMQKQMHWYIRAWCKWLQIHCRWYFHVCLLEKVTRWKCVLVTFKNESVYLSFSAKTKMPGMFLLL